MPKDHSGLKAAIGMGVALLLAMILGLFGSSWVAIAAIAAVLGGIVSFGSNVSTLRQTMAAMTTAEALRSRLIDGIDLRVVGRQDCEANLAGNRRWLMRLRERSRLPAR
jgi:hypothetical protein